MSYLYIGLQYVRSYGLISSILIPTCVFNTKLDHLHIYLIVLFLILHFVYEENPRNVAELKRNKL